MPKETGSFTDVIDQGIPEPTKDTAAFANPFQMPLPQGERLIDTSHAALRVGPRKLIYSYEAEVYNLCNTEERTDYKTLMSSIANAPSPEHATKDKPAMMLVKSIPDKHVTKDGDWLALVEWVECYPDKTEKEGRLGQKDDDDDDDDVHGKMPT